MPASNEKRQKLVVETLIEAFEPLMEADPDALPHEVPQDGRRPVRVLPRQRLPVLRRPGRAPTTAGPTSAPAGCGSTATCTPRTSART